MFQQPSFNNQNLSTAQDYSSSSTTRGNSKLIERHQLRNVRQIDDSPYMYDEHLMAVSNFSKLEVNRNANLTPMNIDASITPRKDPLNQTMPTLSPQIDYKKPRHSQISFPKVEAARGKHSKTTQRIQRPAATRNPASLEPSAAKNRSNRPYLKQLDEGLLVPDSRTPDFFEDTFGDLPQKKLFADKRKSLEENPARRYFRRRFVDIGMPTLGHRRVSEIQHRASEQPIRRSSGSKSLKRLIKEYQQQFSGGSKQDQLCKIVELRR